MKDSILEGYLADFAQEHNYQDLTEADLFELFATYCVASRDNPELGDLQELVVAGSHDRAIDAIVVTINDNVVTTPEAAHYLAKRAPSIDVEFTFIQAKTSPHFKASEIGSFLHGVRTLFAESQKAEENESIANYRAIKDEIFANSIKFSQNPAIHCFYVTTGEWNDDPTLVERARDERELIESTNLFSDVSFNPIDGQRCRVYYQELRRKVAKEIDLQRYAVFPPMPDVRQAYLGVLPCLEYLKLISDSEGHLQRSLFYENVRDFQGDNPVNQEISATLGSSKDQQKLGVLNNGITIVAKSVKQTGNTFRLQDFQIVNGCQTSHVIYRNRTQLDPSVCLPVKIIEANDMELVNQITKATNRQTEVKVEAFESLGQFHKDLEEFYSHYDPDLPNRLYYERRSRQYSDTEILRHQIVTMPFQVKCFVATFLDEPHSTHRYYGELLESYRSRLFQPMHSHWPYFTSAAIYKQIDHLLAQGVLHQWVRKYRYHLAFSYRYSFGTPPPLSNDRKMRAYCETILENLRSDEEGSHFKDLATKIARIRKELEPKATRGAPLYAMRQFRDRIRAEQ